MRRFRRATRAGVAVLSLSLLMSSFAWGDWVLRNGGAPVDAGEGAPLDLLTAANHMPALRVSGQPGPDTLMYVFKRGRDTLVGRLLGRAQGPTWELLTMSGAWSADSQCLPALLSNGIWDDTEMHISNDPAEAPGVFFGTVGSHLRFGTAGTDEHTDTYALRFDGTECQRWTQGLAYDQFDGQIINPCTIWGQMGGVRKSGFDYDVAGHMGLLVSQWAPGNMHPAILLAP